MLVLVFITTGRALFVVLIIENGIFDLGLFWFIVVRRSSNLWKEIILVEFSDLFSMLKKRISDGADVPDFFRDMIAMITDVSEEEWGTKVDPSSKKMSDNTIRNYTKKGRGLPSKLAQCIVYRLDLEMFRDAINERPEATRVLLAQDYVSYNASADKDNIGDLLANCFAEIINTAAGLVDTDALASAARQKQSDELKRQYGEYLLTEAEYTCAFPGCGRKLSITYKGKITHSYDIATIDKKKAPALENLLALCPRCYGLYSLDDDKKKVKELKAVKNILSSHMQSEALLDEAPLEKGIVGVITKVKNIKATDLENASLQPKKIKQKINPADNIALYGTVNLYVTTYFNRIREIITNLDKRGEIDYEELQDQMHGLYRKLKKAKKSQLEIYNEIVGKIHQISMQEDIYCQIVVCYFIQSCEVFDAITK